MIKNVCFLYWSIWAQKHWIISLPQVSDLTNVLCQSENGLIENESIPIESE